MEIETKYYIGQEVWFRKGHLVVKGCITDIFLFKQEGKIVIGYCINDYDHALTESQLFPTKEELLKSL
jgi:hypothetical protein